MGEHKRATIAIMLGKGNAQSEYSEELIRGFRDCAREEDVNLIFLMGPQISDYSTSILSESFSWNYDYQFHTVYDYALPIRPDALIIAYGSLAGFSQIPDRDAFLARYRGIPCLLIEDRTEHAEVPYLVTGNYSGMRLCMEHLVEEHGYRRIAFVGGPPRNFDSNERLRAYRDVLAEHGIAADETMVVHGDYSEEVDAQVEYLLDRHPGLEAIVFANDNMAKAGYRVCAARNLLVGHDIAITGFDDSDIAKAMEPPLTSVSHSGALFSRSALKRALMLCRGERPGSQEMETVFCKRASCGCPGSVERPSAVEWPEEELSRYIAERAEEMAEEMFLSIPYEQEKRRYKELLRAFFAEVQVWAFAGDGETPSAEPLLRTLKDLCGYERISDQRLLEYVGRLLQELAGMAEGQRYHAGIVSALHMVQQYIHSRELIGLQEELLEKDRKEWFIPSFAMDLLNRDLTFQENMRLILERLHAMQIPSAYLFFFAQPMTVREGTPMHVSDRLFLGAYSNGGEMQCYSEKNWIPVSEQGGIAAMLPQDRAHHYTAFVLFAGEEQYGVMLCEAKQKDIPFLLLCSLQMGFMRKVLLMMQQEERMKRELQEKNRILNFISAYDELTGALNRRGFMELAVPAIERHSGGRGYLLFADLDHLKEINDSFGHAAGDFAIQTLASYLRECLSEGSVIARMGGDEFAAVVFPENGEACSALVDRIKQHAAAFNARSGQPFYVEASVGVCEFVCDAGLDLVGLLRQSDRVLYEDKTRRRASVRRG